MSASQEHGVRPRSRTCTAVDGGDHRGCLLCTAAAGSAANDPDIAQVVQAGLAKLRRGFQRALRETPTLAGLSEPERLRLADVLLTQYVGLRMLARSQLSLGVLAHAVAGVDEILGAAGQRRFP